MKKAIKLAVLVMASAMMMSGCGKEEKIASEDLNVQEDYGNVERGIGQGGTEAQEDLQEVAINSYEELENYQGGRMEKIKDAYESCGIEYEVTPNQCFLYGVEESYEILEKKYEILQMAYSLYNYEQNQLNTVIDFEYDFHPDKGVSLDDKYIQLLSALIHTTENNELKEKFPTTDVLVSEITNCIGVREDCIIFETQNCRLNIEVDGSARYILGFVSVENVRCNIPRVEPTYKEFASLDEYMAYANADMPVDTSKYQGSHHKYQYFELSFIEVNQTVLSGTFRSTSTAYGIENNLAMLFGEYSYPELGTEHMPDVRDVLEDALEYLEIPDLDVEKAIDEMISNDIVRMNPIEYCYASEWFGASPTVDQYPFMQRGDVVIPIKVEGMLNR